MTWITPRTAGIAIACVALATLPAATGGSAASEPVPRDSASGTATGKHMHKPYAVAAEDAGRCGAPTKLSSDPEEGGQVSAKSGTGWGLNKNVKAGAASDPEEGGQVTARSTGAPSVSDMSVTKHVDSASTKPMESAEPGGSCPAPAH